MGDTCVGDACLNPSIHNTEDFSFEGVSFMEGCLLLATFASSFAFSCVLLFVWRQAAPAIPAFISRSANDHMYIENSVVTLYPSIISPLLALYALVHMPLVPDAAPTPAAIVATGISCGYMLYDLIWLILHRDLGTPIMIGHHVLSVLAFPYAVLRHRCVVFVLFFLCTEITGVPQHVRMLMLKFGLEDKPYYTIVGISWTVSFFFVRILPSPFLIYSLASNSWAAFTAFDFIFSMVTVPLPFLLNAYWFYALVAGVLKFLAKSSVKREAASASDYKSLR